jgi:general secretion pathway protein D
MGSTAGGFGNPGGAANGSPGGGLGGGLNGKSGGSAFNGGGSESSDSGTMAGGLGGTSSGFGNTSAGGSSASAASDQQYSSSDGSVKISSVDNNNQLLVRARPSQWEEIKAAIRKLDNVPMQVQIETRILEVSLTGDFQFGVQWYLEGLTGSTTDSSGNIVPGQPYRHRQVALGQGGTNFNPADALFYSFINSKMQVALSAMETSGNTKTLSAPSMVVMNNQTASIAVGDQIPINQTSVNTGIGTATSYSQVTYLNTGVILNVQPRINPGGLVYMNISQEVSQADKSVPLVNGNPAISQRKLATQVAVQSGQTVLLGGLIQQAEGNTDTGIPGVNRVPILGRLFGTTNRSRNRTELIVLITPRVIRGSEDARQITDDYQNKFESLAPLRASTEHAAGTAPAIIVPLPTTAPAPGWPEQLQQHAETALQHSDYTTAQELAMQSWKQGSRHGALCERNWQVIIEARKHSNRLGTLDAARKQQAECLR